MPNKICVYTVCRNESQFVDKWCDSVFEADVVTAVVHDTKDDTAEKLIAHGVKVAFTHYQNWRFDTSKNDALAFAKMVAPECNIFAFVSLDEVFNPGWAQTIRDNWKEDDEICMYKFVQSHDDNGQDALTTGFNWIHSGEDAWYWKYPVDEVLIRDDKPVSELKYCNLFDQVTLHHWPDYSKPRPYVELHELRYKEFPDDTSVLCLVRDYHWMQAYDKLDSLLDGREITSLNLNNEEKAFITMCVADGFRFRENKEKAIEYYKKAIELCSSFRDTYVQFATLLCEYSFHAEAERVLKQMFKSTWRSYSYLEDPNCWMASPYIWMTVALYSQEKYSEAFIYATMACEKDKFDELAKSNYNLCLEKIKELY